MYDRIVNEGSAALVLSVAAARRSSPAQPGGAGSAEAIPATASFGSS